MNLNDPWLMENCYWVASYGDRETLQKGALRSESIPLSQRGLEKPADMHYITTMESVFTHR